jgi:hypothetical protein
MIKHSFFTLLLFVATAATPQRISHEYLKYDWDTDPKLHELRGNETKEGTVILRDKRMHEFFYDIQGNLLLYTTHHRTIKVNSDKSIEENNKVYISASNVLEFVEVKARSLSKDGKVTVLNKTNIKDVDNLENSGPYKIFAFEGVEVGSEIEYLYTTKKYPNSYVGGGEFVQSDEIRHEVEISLICPDNLKFELKSYNGFSEFKDSRLDGDRRIYTAKMDTIPLLKSEKYAAYQANLMRVEYRLASNDDKKLFSYSIAADRYYSVITGLEKNHKKDVAKLLKKIKLDKKASTEIQIKQIESYVKQNFLVFDLGGSDLFSDVSQVIKGKIGSEVAMLKIYVELFRQAKLDAEVVFTTERGYKRFDANFESWAYLDKILLYFPAIDQFMAPGEKYTRTGFVPQDWTENDGLFVKPVEAGGVVMGVGKVKKIKTPGYKLSYDNIYADIKFDNDFTETTIHLKRTFTGYSSAGIQPLYTALPDDQRKGLVNDLMKIIAEDSKISDTVVSNYDEQSLFIKPFTIEGNVKTQSMFEKAGDKYLFKIGNVIGPQAELYQEEKRKTDVENEFNRGYYREITFTIPDGYKITNLSALNFNVACGDASNPEAEFKSSYTINGNKVKIVIDENYRQLILPITKFEDFRKVINAAADFNKVVLFLEKK